MNLKNKCRQCNFYKRLYMQHFYSFSWFKLFYCTFKEEFISADNYCENFKRKQKIFDLSPERFDEVEEDIKFLIDYFKDE